MGCAGVTGTNRRSMSSPIGGVYRRLPSLPADTHKPKVSAIGLSPHNRSGSAQARGVTSSRDHHSSSTIRMGSMSPFLSTRAMTVSL